MDRNYGTLQSIVYKSGTLKVLDQLLLPLRSEYVDVKSVNDGWKIIHSMQVRGAPAIAIVGCLSVAIEIGLENWDGKTGQDVVSRIGTHLDYILTSRPTAVNLKNAAIHLKNISSKLTHLPAEEVVSQVTKEIEGMLAADIADNEGIGNYGMQAIVSKNIGREKLNILTHCNTGSLATAGYGTALGVIRSLHAASKLERCYYTETRPYMQGARLTGYELIVEKIPATLICDSAVAALMSMGKVSAVIVGADRVAANGDTANKIGTYQIAVLASHHKVPFYVAAPFTSIDFSMADGKAIVIEERPSTEMTQIASHQITHPDVVCWNVAFDVTPGSLITGIVTEKGTFTPSELHALNSSK